MAVTLYEQARSRSTTIDLRAGSKTIEYMALAVAPFTESDDEDVIAALEATAPVRYGFQLRRTIEIKPLGGPVWMGTVAYGFDEGDSIDPGEGDRLPYEFSFDTTGGTQKITQSLATVHAVKYGVPTTPRTVNDAVTIAPRTGNDVATTAGSPAIQSATAAFTPADVGAICTSTTPGMLAPNTTIASYVSATVVVLSVAALSTVASTGNLTVSNPKLTSATAAFTSADVGAALSSTTANMLAAGATARVVVSATEITMSAGALSAQAAGNLSIQAAAPPNYNRAIGVSRDGVAGTDRIAPKLEFQIVRNFQGMTMQFIQTLRSLTSSTNEEEFFGFAPGELLFLGATGAPSQNNDAAREPICRVTFRFAASPNLTDIDLVPDDASGNHLLRVPEKLGFDYLWVSYRNDVIGQTNVQRPDAAYVEQIYDFDTFADLLIGTYPGEV